MTTANATLPGRHAIPSAPSPSAPTPNLKILLIADITSAQFGGEAALPAHLFRVMRHRGLDVRLITHARTRDELAGLFPHDLDRITFVPDRPLHRFLDKIGRPLPARVRVFTTEFVNRLTSQLWARRAARKMVAEYGIDVIHQPTPVSPREFSVLYNMGAPVVFGPLNGGMSFPPAFRKKESLHLRLFIAAGRATTDFLNWLLPGKPHAALVMVANERSRQALPSGLRGDVRLLVENGVDLRVWKPAETSDTAAVSSADHPTCPTRFVYVGRLVDLKGVDLLLRALHMIRPDTDARLTVVGDGPERAALEALTAELHLTDRVEFLGWKSQPDCAAVLRDADAFVLPSLHECGGAVVLEAMCVGLPVIATDWGGPADYLDETCGILVPPTSRDAFITGLASAMRRLATDPALRTRLAQAGQRRATQQFNWDHKVDTILSYYTDAITTRRPSSTRP